jgi:hypothetical protein
LSIGSDSPVSGDSSTWRSDPVTNRTSAVSTSPASSTTMSPGTRSPAGRRCTVPPRRTVASVCPSSRRASIERTARLSVTKPIAPLMKITAMIAKPSTGSSNAKATSAAAPRRATIRLANWSQSMRHALLRPVCRSRLGPYWRRRRRASASESPRSIVVPSASRAAAASVAHGVRRCEPPLGDGLRACALNARLRLDSSPTARGGLRGAFDA